MPLTPQDSADEPEYPYSDGKPIAENDFTRDALFYAVNALEKYFADRSDVYVSANLFVYYERGIIDAVVAPDVFVIFGAEKHARQNYKVWEEGGATPNFILEITSESTRYTDNVTKRRIYVDLGVDEYFLYDPARDYLDPLLQGFCLTDTGYEPMTPNSNVSDALSIHSEVLGLDLRLDDGELRFYVPEAGQKLLSYREAMDALCSRVEQLLATGMPVEQVAAIAKLDADDLRRRFEV